MEKLDKVLLALPKGLPEVIPEVAQGVFQGPAELAPKPVLLGSQLLDLLANFIKPYADSDHSESLDAHRSDDRQQEVVPPELHPNAVPDMSHLPERCPDYMLQALQVPLHLQGVEGLV